MENENKPLAEGQKLAPPAKKQIIKPLKLSNLDDVYNFAKKLKKYITDNKLSVQIQGREYAYVDGWKFALVSFGLVPIVGSPERIDAGKLAYIFSRWVEFKNKYGKIEKVLKVYFAGTNSEVAEEIRKKQPPDHEMKVEYFAYRCECSLKNMATGEIVGSGYALCTNIESKKTGFDEYAVLSMSQTRAIGKASRNLIGFVMNHAGLESTPAEEMEPLVDPMMPPAGITEEEKKPADDFTDMKIEVGDCKSLEELEKIWNKYPENHSNQIFQQIIRSRKLQISNIKK